MAATIDHLSVDHRITVLRDFVDARGVRRRAGESGVIVAIQLDWKTHDVVIEWRRGEQHESMTFALAAKDGPRNGHMREYFELGEYVPPPAPNRTFVPELGLVSSGPMQLPALARDLVRGPGRRDEALDRVWALAGRRRFAEAEEQLRALDGAHAPTSAAALTAIAERHAFDQDADVYEWLRDRALRLWFSWGAEATSGGDGAARMLEIQPALDRFTRLDRWRATQR